jgi:hypothetical protein
MKGIIPPLTEAYSPVFIHPQRTMDRWNNGELNNAEFKFPDSKNNEWHVKRVATTRPDTSPWFRMQRVPRTRLVRVLYFYDVYSMLYPPHLRRAHVALPGLTCYLQPASVMDFNTF